MSHEPEFESQGTSPPQAVACGHPCTPENTTFGGRCRACLIKPPRFRRHNHPRVPENMTSAGRQTQGRKRLDADHDHDTGKVRGLLCNPCNMFVARFESGTLRRPDLIEQVRAYLGREQAA